MNKKRKKEIVMAFGIIGSIVVVMALLSLVV